MKVHKMNILRHAVKCVVGSTTTAAPCVPALTESREKAKKDSQIHFPSWDCDIVEIIIS